MKIIQRLWDIKGMQELLTCKIKNLLGFDDKWVGWVPRKVILPHRVIRFP